MRSDLEERRRDLIHAIRYEDIEDVDQALARADKDPDFLVYALCNAARSGSLEKCQRIFDVGAKAFTARSLKTGLNPLQAAVESRNIEIADLLISHDPEGRTLKKKEMGKTPLDALASRSDVLDENARALMTRLIEAGSPLDGSGDVDNGSTTTLCHAMGGSNRDAAQILLAQTGSISLKDQGGARAFKELIAGGHFNWGVDVLIEHGVLDLFEGERREHLLRDAVRSENRYAVNAILEHMEFDLEARVLGGTVLHEAILQGDPDLVECLIDHGARVDTPDEHGSTPLSLAQGWQGVHSDIASLIERAALERQAPIKKTASASPGGLSL